MDAFYNAEMFLRAQPTEGNQCLLVVASNKGPYEDLIRIAKLRNVTFVVFSDLHTFRNINALQGRLFEYVIAVNVEPNHSFMHAIYNRMRTGVDTSINFFSTPKQT